MAKSETEPMGEATRQVRVFEDMGEMISWIVRVEGGTTANLLDPMIRVQIEAKYAKHRAVIDKIKAADDELQRVEKEAKQRASESVRRGRKE